MNSAIVFVHGTNNVAAALSRIGNTITCCDTAKGCGAGGVGGGVFALKNAAGGEFLLVPTLSIVIRPLFPDKDNGTPPTFGYGLTDAAKGRCKHNSASTLPEKMWKCMAAFAGEDQIL